MRVTIFYTTPEGKGPRRHHGAASPSGGVDGLEALEEEGEAHGGEAAGAAKGGKGGLASSRLNKFIGHGVACCKQQSASWQVVKKQVPGPRQCERREREGVYCVKGTAR